MKRFVVGALVVGAAAIVLLAGAWAMHGLAAHRGRSAAVNNDQSVAETDRALLRAISTGDAKAAEAMIDRRFTATDTAGRIRNKLELLHSLANPPADGERRDLTVRRYSRVAAVTGSVAAPGGEVVFVHVYVKRRAGWKAIAFHDSAAVADAVATSDPPVAARPCDNPCRSIPYKPRERVEQEIVAAFQAAATAVVGDDANEWVKHVTDDFVAYRSNAPPAGKVDPAAPPGRLRPGGGAMAVGELQGMKLWVFGDAAVMTADEAASGAHLPSRATRIFVRRDGRWQMSLSQQTAVTR
jgi:hypothetical protein